MYRLSDPDFLFPTLWGAFTASWVVAALWAAAPVRRAPSREIRRSLALAVVGAALMMQPATAWQHGARLWAVTRGQADVLALLTIPGFLFAWWARIHLGRLWSGSVTLKTGHVVVQSGPYGLVRHPIYTGLLASALITALAAGTVWSLVGFLLLLVGFSTKAGIEERFLAAELGEAAYASYRQRVPKLVPGWPAFQIGPRSRM